VSDLTCREVADSAPGFALDILDPSARAQVAAHLIRCAGCRETVTGMQDSAARLLDLGAGWGEETEWPDWPEQADLPPVRPARRRLRLVTTMAAVAVLLVGTTLGPEIEQAASTSERPVATAVIMSGGQAVGSVHLYGGPVPAIGIQVTHLPVAGPLNVLLVSRDGRSHRLGRLQLAGGAGSWVGPDPVPAAEVNGLALVDGTGNDVAFAGSIQGK
jgi:hypothetical protein